MTTEVETPLVPVEIQWAILQYIRMGFNEPQTEILIDEHIDHHDAFALLERGCPHDLAVDILRP